MTRLGFLRFRSGGFGVVVIGIFLRDSLCFPNRAIDTAWADNLRINGVLCPRAERRTQDQYAKEPNSIAPNHARKIMEKTSVRASACAADRLRSRMPLKSHKSFRDVRFEWGKWPAGLRAKYYFLPRSISSTS